MGNSGKMVSGILLIVFVVQIACSVKQEREIRPQIIYNKGGYNLDSLGVYLTVTAFENFEQLRKRVDEIRCNGGLPIIKISTKEADKFIPLSRQCLAIYFCTKIHRNNSLCIEDNFIRKRQIVYPIDSLYDVMKQDYSNFGINRSYKLTQT